MKKGSLIGKKLAEQAFRELGITMGKNGKIRKRRETKYGKAKGSYGKLREEKRFRSPVNSPKLPFRIPVVERTTRQAQSLQGYKASGYWQTASLLRDLIQLFLEIIPSHQFRRKTQLEDAARSFVANIEEGWARPSTKEYLDYLGFSQGSLTEVRGDIERLYVDGYLKSGKFLIPTPSLKFPYPPVNSRKNPTQYGKIRERLREYTGRNIDAKDLTYEIFIEFINKTDYLLKKTVFGLQEKIIKKEKEKLSSLALSRGFVLPSLASLIGILGTGLAMLFNIATNHHFEYKTNTLLSVNPVTVVGDVTSGKAFTKSGKGNSLFFHGTRGGIGELTGGDILGDHTYTLPEATGTIVTTGNLSAVTSVGTIASGAWSGTAISTKYGGTGQDFSSTVQGSLPYLSSTGVFSALSPSTSGYVLITNGSGANPTWQNLATSSGNFWRQNNGALYPENNTVDLLIGGTASSSAKFSFTSINSGTPTFSMENQASNLKVKASTANAIRFLDASDNVWYRLSTDANTDGNVLHKFTKATVTLDAPSLTYTSGDKINTGGGVSTVGIYPGTYTITGAVPSGRKLYLDGMSLYVSIPTITSSTSNVVEYASNFHIAGPALAAGSISIKRNMALHVEDGASVFGTSGAYSSDMADIIGSNPGIVIGKAANHQQQNNLLTLVSIGYTDATQSANMYFMRTAGSSGHFDTAVSNGDVIGSIGFRGSDGNSAAPFVASISATVDGTVSAGVVPGRLTFNTTNSSGVPTEAMRIDSSQNVGIGTVSPNTKLQLHAAATNLPDISFTDTTTGSTGSDGFSIGGDGSQDGYLWNYENQGIYFGTNNTERMRLNAGGNLGIGTTAPQSLLDIQGPLGGGAATAGILTLATKELTIVDNDQLGRINFNAPLESDGTDAILAGAAMWAEAEATFSTTVNSTALVFGTATTSTAVERMRLDSAGTLYINDGTNTSIAADLTTAYGTGVGQYIQRNSATASLLVLTDVGVDTGGPDLHFAKTRSTNGSGDTIVVDGDILGQMAFRGADGVDYAVGARFRAEVDGTPGSGDMPGRFVFLTTPDGTETAVERMRINAGGNVGIGCADPNHLLELGGTSTGCDTGTGSWIAAGSTAFTANSSQEWKQNIATFSVDNILDRIAAAPIRTYDWKPEYCQGSDCTNALGFIAQEFYPVLQRGDNLHVNGQDIMSALWLGEQALYEKVKNFDSQINLLSAKIDQQASISAVLGLGDVELNNATVSADLMVLGRATVTDLGVTGSINNGLLAIHGLDGEINTLAGDLYLQKDIVGGVNILNGKIVIDTNGNLTVAGSITAKKINIDTTDGGAASVGSGTIASGQTSVNISSIAVTASSRIFVTATSKTGKQELYVKEKSAGSGFTIEIEESYGQDITFDWWIVN